MKLGPHTCAKFNGLRSPGKRKRHARRCATCRDYFRKQAER